jgi:hypothetical protein
LEFHIVAFHVVPTQAQICSCHSGS